MIGIQLGQLMFTHQIAVWFAFIMFPLILFIIRKYLL